MKPGPRRLVRTQSELALKFFSGKTLFACYHEIESEKPDLQTFAGSVKGGSRGERVMTAATVANVDRPSGKEVGFRPSAPIALEAVRPLLLKQIFGTRFLRP